MSLDRTRRWPWRRGLATWKIVFFFVVTALAGGIWQIHRIISDALHADMALFATRVSIEAAGDYLTKHDGNWPRSWKDLENSSPQMERYPFTRGADKVQEFVLIDFNADPDLLAKETAEDFKAIRPVGRCIFTEYKSEIPFLLETIRRTRRLPPKQLGGKAAIDKQR